MDQKFTNWLVKEIKIGKVLLAPLDILLLIGTTVAGVLLRSSVWNAVLENAAYQNESVIMKIITAVFDLVVAVLLALLVNRLTRHKIKSFLAYGIGMLLPVMAAGSAMWGMGDSIYVGFALLGLYFLLLSKESNLYFVLALVFCGIAVFFNLYALFLLPVYIWCFFARKAGGNTVLSFLFPILGAVLHFVLNQGLNSVFPLFRAEAELADSRMVQLSYNWPNIYQIIGTDSYLVEYGTVGKYLILGVIAMLVVAGIYRQKEMSAYRVLTLSFLLCVFVPYVMPYMNERAGILGAVLAVVYGFAFLEQFFVPIVQVTITYLAYAAYFRGSSFLPMPGIALVELAVLLYLCYEYLTGKTQR